MTSYEKGLWKVVCDRCGKRQKSDKLRREWTGFMVCNDGCFEVRNQQEFVTGKADRQAPPWVRPDTDGPDITVETGTPVRPEDL